MSAQTEVAIVIPSLDPDEKMTVLIKKLTEAGFKKILVINDGSDSQYDRFYERAQEFGCTVLKHAVNWGKGRALKTAFNYFLNELPQYIGLVAVDSDGQHSVEDTIRCAQALLEHPDALVLGCRDFKKESIPFRSRFGNVLTCKVLKALCGVGVSDSQTGLRGFSRQVMKQFMDTKGERFEFETNMLIETKEKDIPILEVPIETIYIENNATSHFNPLKDSLKIYAVFGKFLFASFSSFVIDILLFALFISLTKAYFFSSYILVSTVGARIVSSTFNFLINKNKVFQNKSGGLATYIKYAVLCIGQMLLSAGGVFLLHSYLRIGESIAKIVVDCVLFLIGFQIQREWVFGKDRN